MEMNREKHKWHWEGSIWYFLDIVQWAFVYHKVGTEKPDNWTEIMRNPELVKQKAEEYGMTYDAIIDEMLRIGKDGKNMLRILDEHND